MKMRRSPRDLFVGRSGPIAAADLTGGTHEVVQLDDNGIRKVRLRLELGGVSVTADLEDKEASAFLEQLGEVYAWTRGRE